MEALRRQAELYEPLLEGPRHGGSVQWFAQLSTEDEIPAVSSPYAAKLQPLFNQWNQKPSGNESTLIVEPVLVSLQVVSRAARFWIGPFAGDSTIDLTLKLTDKGSGTVIAQPRVARSAGAMTGNWSVGKSDQNLLDYIAAIAHEYLVSNY